MKPLTLVLDATYLCHRAYHSVGKSKLDHDGQQTAVVYGFFRDILILQKRFNTTRLVFCFDVGKPRRTLDYSEYKANRHKPDNLADSGDYRSFQDQVTNLRKLYLPALGYKNILSSTGYEADDLVAVTVDLLGKQKQKCIIVSADKDLYQCLHTGCSQYNPVQKKLFTAKDFVKTYGIEPYQWALVKAIAGCTTDNVPGIRGIGELTAAKYIAGNLSKGKKHSAIEEGIRIQESNMQLVFLPYRGTPIPELKPDRLARNKWKKVMERLGMKSLIRQYPIA